ncbi:AAA family ATPase [Rubrivivax rivuli]|uniref:ATPase n=1 Tax=Rubrivivax rivuli TaxID=1862385 RepID=A0A437REI5_9BURK|nr:ATP-binding protein [Rubrivivax rivuli]RVU45168.1 ATPase [Rubrivivax rivuli]
MQPALLVAIVGAESTGKTTLAAALAEALARESGRRVAWVPEVLREWCDHTGRTPLAHEQASMMRAQHERLNAAAETHDIVVCDTTALMTAVYSRIVFGDRSLDERAVALHRRAGVTLLTALDLPWVPDGLQRDGPQVREPVDHALRELMHRHGIAHAIVAGSGQTRLQNALAATRPALFAQEAPASARRGGLFTSLTGLGNGAAARWSCECCVPAFERALQGAASQAGRY